jgi:aspartyl/glutamyl-tRNA(Asn/Gln) amidotransferase C subunit
MAKDDKTSVDTASQITDQVLAEVIDLARLDPLAPGMALQKEHLRSILDHFKVLSRVEVDDLDPTIMVNPTPIPLREDQVVDRLSPEEALANSRLRTSEFFRAPTILEEEES